jgi:UDP-galactopyranose mutase
MKRFCIVGAGLSGVVIARILAENGFFADVMDERLHIGGNCHTERDAATGVMVHQYGPHIFHTSDERVWEFVNRFAEMRPYRHRVIAKARGRIFSMPINLLTINQFYGLALGPDEARKYLRDRIRIDSREPANFEEMALSVVGEDLYRTFFHGYTSKQWGCEPRELPSSIFKRLPVRFDYDDSYFDHQWQAIPVDGYTAMIERIIAHPNIRVSLGRSYAAEDANGDHVIYSGPIDRYFDYAHGRLDYRTLYFERFKATEDHQGTAVVNYCDEDVPFTRITEHRHFAPWEQDRLTGSVLYREYSRACQPSDIPYYPIRSSSKQKALDAYLERAKALENVTFVGRLGTYRYIDMDVCIKEALEAADQLLARISVKSLG